MTETFVREPLETRVARGASFLDRHSSRDWFNGGVADDVVDFEAGQTAHIELDKLRLEDGSTCVLGQAYGDYLGGLNQLQLRPHYEEGEYVVRGAFRADVDPPELQEALDRYVANYGSDGTEYALGFNLPRDEQENGWDPLTDAWKGAIAGRRMLHAIEQRERLNTYQVIAVVEAESLGDAEEIVLRHYTGTHELNAQLLHTGPKVETPAF